MALELRSQLGTYLRSQLGTYFMEQGSGFMVRSPPVACALEGLQVRLAPPLHLGKFILHRFQTLRGKRDILAHFGRIRCSFAI